MKVFIHGVPDTGYMWSPLLSTMNLAPDSYLTPTMPGFDGVDHPGFSATMDAYLAWVIQTIETTAKAHGPIDLVGHDWGAPLSAMAAQARPDLIRTWAIINAAPEPSFKWHSLARLWQTPVLGELFMLIGNAARFEKSLVEAGMPAALAAQEAPRIDPTMKRSILKLYRSAKDPTKWAADFSIIAQKGLVLWAADDPYVPVNVAHRFTERWGIPLVVEPGLGHWGICERPDLFAVHLNSHWGN